MVWVHVTMSFRTLQEVWSSGWEPLLLSISAHSCVTEQPRTYMNHNSTSICHIKINLIRASWWKEDGSSCTCVKVYLAPHIREYLFWVCARFSPLWRKPSLIWNLSRPYSWDMSLSRLLVKSFFFFLQLLAHTFSPLLMPVAHSALALSSLPWSMPQIPHS